MKYLIWSAEHQAWWAPNSMGYTRIVIHAGEYGFDEADLICRNAGKLSNGRDSEVMIPATVCAKSELTALFEAAEEVSR